MVVLTTIADFFGDKGSFAPRVIVIESKGKRMIWMVPDLASGYISFPFKAISAKDGAAGLVFLRVVAVKFN